MDRGTVGRRQVRQRANGIIGRIVAAGDDIVVTALP
jgi:hypothetical protein